MMSFVGWTGTVIACIGSLLLALKVPISRYAFVCYLIANALLISYAVLRTDYPLLANYLGLTLISLLGLCRWFTSREGRGSVQVTLECDQFARRQKAIRAAFGSRLSG
jgi:hypothetical protein